MKYFLNFNCELFSQMSRDWVVELDGGLREAERLAAQTETDLLGEVIPGSGLYQLRERSSRVRREAAAGQIPESSTLERLLAEDSHVKSFSHQAALKARRPKVRLRLCNTDLCYYRE